MQFAPVVLFHLFGLPVYAFGLCVSLSVLLCAVFLKRREKKLRLAPQTASVFVFYALILSLVLARLLYCLLRWQQIAYDCDDAFRGFAILAFGWEGGYTLYGAFIGVILAAWIAARRTKQPFLRLLDWAAPAGALMVALGRGAEILGGGGFGAEVPQSGPAFFPFAVYNDWLGSWNYAVFMAEAAAALLILSVLLRLARKPRRAGDIALLFLLYFSAAQMVLERLRRDDFLAWGFVLTAQVIAAALILFVAAIAVARAFRAGKRKGLALFSGLLAIAAVVWSAVTEFLFDKNLFGVIVIGDTALHLIRAALLLAVSALLTVLLLKTAEGQSSAAAADAAE